MSSTTLSKMQSMWNSLKADDGIELTKHTPYFKSFSQSSGFSDAGAFKHNDTISFRSHPDVKVEDLVGYD
jgi:hypothetical protein